MVFFSQKRAISSLAVVAIGTTLRREEGTGGEGGDTKQQEGTPTLYLPPKEAACCQCDVLSA